MDFHTVFKDFLAVQLPVEQVIWFCAEIANGLLFLWNNNIVHCALTLENIWLSENSFPVISNFGNAEFVNERGFVEVQRMKKNKNRLPPEVLPQDLKTKLFVLTFVRFKIQKQLWIVRNNHLGN